MGSRVQAALRAIRVVEDGLLVGSLVVLMLMAVTQILLRNLFDSGLFWADSFVRVLVLWVALLGAMVATREQRHISIDLLSRVLSQRARGVVSRVVTAGSALVCGVAGWYCAAFIAIEMEDGTIAFGVVPNWVCELILPLGFAVMALRFLIHTIVPPQPAGGLGSGAAGPTGAE